MIKIFLTFGFLLVIAQTASVKKDKRCEASSTIVSGTHAPSEVCSGDIVFQEEFDTLDFKKWEHENTLGGGGVSVVPFLLIII